MASIDPNQAEFDVYAFGGGGGVRGSIEYPNQPWALHP